MGVAGSEFSFDISTESTSEETQQNIHQLSATWAIVLVFSRHYYAAGY
jgi:hypothetical protein